MKKCIIQTGLACWLALAAGFSGMAAAEEYVYRDLMGNTLPSTRCQDSTAASANATDDYLLKKRTQVFCETQGYGWHVSERKAEGKLVCNECQDAGKQGVQCHLEDIVVTCKRLKPGSVGLFPGEG